MKRVLYNQYGDVSQLQVAEAPVPVVGPSEMLVKVHAVSINPIDWKIVAGEMKLFTGSKFPRGIGIDFSGVVESTGGTVTAFKHGDAVFGALDGFKGAALAEFITVQPHQIMKKPDTISFEQAAALPVTGSTAVRILQDVAKVKAGTEILINGATGGVGMFATQIAKEMGAVVTSVASTRGLEAAKQWGSDHVINYREENVLERGVRYDVVVDLSDKLPFRQAKTIMKDRSIYVNTIPTPVEVVTSKLYNLFAKKQNKALITQVTPRYLQSLAAYAADGLDIRIHQTYPMASVVEAYREAERGGILGKSVFIVHA